MNREIVRRELEARAYEDVVRRMQDPLMNPLTLTGVKSAVQQMAEDFERQNAAIRAVIGPSADLQIQQRLASESALQAEIERIKRHAVEYEAQFRLPDIIEAKRLATEVLGSPISEAMRRSLEQFAETQRAMKAIGTPWLKIDDPLRSVTAFADLQGIGHALRTMPPFDEQLAQTLRVGLGDWRDPITWPAEIFTDAHARSAFYVDRGFDPALTDFPAPAFDESLDIAGFYDDLPPLVALYGPPVPPSDDEEEEEGFRRTNRAHDWLMRFESCLRRFIDELMTQAYGASWPRHRLPNGLYERWHEAKQKALRDGRPDRPLINHADFMGYIDLICRDDNWQDVFAAHFRRKEFVRESFQRLHPLRNDTMHANPISQDDELFLFAEVTRLMRSIRR